jgi:ADP-ribose pyrophosphatase YjhB (NUDIX family)
MHHQRVLQDGEQVEVADNSQRWLSSWHRADEPPEGRPHGALGVCVTNTNEVVLVSRDGLAWSFPSGRPEGAESWEDTLRREMMEEACAVVLHARLLGFSQGKCIEGKEKGLVLVRSIWLAQVTLLPWKPEFEISHRKLVLADKAISEIAPPDDQLPFWRRVFAEAKLMTFQTRCA